MDKAADLLPGTELQPHQKRLAEEAASGKPLRKLLYWALGSGKSLGALAAAESAGGSYAAVVPASLRSNLRKETEKFTDEATPARIESYTAVGSGKDLGDPNTLIADEAQRLRSPGTAQSRNFLRAAKKAPNLLLLSGSPVVNGAGDLAPLISALTKKDITPDQFTSRYVGTKNVYPSLLRRMLRMPVGQESEVQHADELKSLLRGHVDYYAPAKSVVPTQYEDVHTTMGVEQSRLYKAMFDKLPFYLRWKLKHDYPLSADELRRMRSFLTGPRQVGLSTYPYLRTKDPYKAFQQSPKLQEAHKRLLTKLEDPRAKALVFSNFIDAGLSPYAAALAKSKIPHAVFHGGLTDADRKKLVDDFNHDRIRTALIGPSGTEGLSFKGTQLVQLLDPDWQPVRPQQAVGRALRFDSHTDLPPELQNVKVERFIARLPPGLKDRILQAVGFNRERNLWAADDHLRHIEERKKRLNQKFLDLLREVGSEGR